MTPLNPSNLLALIGSRSNCNINSLDNNEDLLVSVIVVRDDGQLCQIAQDYIAFVDNI
jgi:hypothetical protein